MPFPVAAVNTVPAPRTLANWIPMKTVPTWPAVTTTVGFEVWERPLPADLQAGPSNDGDRANLSHDNEKGFNVVKLQVKGMPGVRTFGTPEPLDRSVDLNNPLRIKS